MSVRGIAAAAGLLLASALSCGTRTGDDQRFEPSCAVCRGRVFTCDGSAGEAASLVIDSADFSGCTGRLVGFSQSLRIDCDSRRVCTDGRCEPAVITESTFRWSDVTCTPD